MRTAYSVRTGLSILFVAGISLLACDGVDPVAPGANESDALLTADMPSFDVTGGAPAVELEYSIEWMADGELVSRVIAPIETAETVEEFYSYGQPNTASANTGYEKEDVGSILLHRDTNTGRVSLVVIYDGPGNTGHLQRRMFAYLDPFVSRDSFPVLDDGTPYGSDTYERPTINNSSVVRANNRWSDCCTDGWAARADVFMEPFQMALRFGRIDGYPGIPGLEWVDGDGERVTIPLQSGETRITITAALAEDDTPPVVTPTITGTLGDNGWYTSLVSLTWSVIEEESPITETVGCEDFAFNFDSNGVTKSCEVTSEGGTTSKSVTMKKDATPPVINFTNNAGQYGASETVDIGCVASDSRSGLASSTCVGASGLARDFGLGTHTIEASAVDNAGNETVAITSFDVVDDTPPTISATVNGTQGINGWYTSDVSVTWLVEDPETAVSTSGCGDQTVSDDTGGELLTCEATSEGGTSSESVTVLRDASPPVITFSGNAGTYNGLDPVNITCSASDATSGIRSVTCEEASGIGADFGAGTTTLTATAEDNAGNSITVTTSFEVIDVTPPVVTPTVSGPLGANGWYTGDVTVSWSVNDPESPVSANGCDAVTLTTDTNGETYTCIATSLGGTTTESVTVKRDATPPVITFSGNAGSYGGVEPVDITCSASDGMSGIESVDCEEASGFGADFGLGPTTLKAEAADHAGNTATVTTSFEVIDVTPPVVTPTVSGTLGDDGWYTSDVTVSWSVTDPETSVSANGCETTTLTTDTHGETYTCTAASLGGTTTESVTVKRDATDPAITFPGNDGSYLPTDVVDIGCSADDGTSGIADASCQAADAPAWTFGPGITTLTATARDIAGNTSGASASFEVEATAEGICALVEEWVSNRGVANALCQKLGNSARSDGRGRGNAAAGQIGAFVNQVEALRGKRLSDVQADALIAFAGAL